jgi:simple sugar transport system permease protein
VAGWEEIVRTERESEVSEATKSQQVVPDIGPPSRNGTLALLRGGLGAFGRQREATVFVVAVALLLYFGIRYNSTFVSQTNGVVLFSEFAAPIAIIAVGEVLLLICGEIDLSVGFIYTYAPIFMFFMITYYHFPGWLGVIAGLLIGAVAGAVNGFLTVGLGLPSFITTLGTGFILLGLAYTGTHDEPLNIPPNTMGMGAWIGRDGWSMTIWMVALVLIFTVVLTRTRFGLHTVAVGGNQLGARESGIHVARVKYAAFMITGVLGALVGLQNAFYSNTIDPNAGGYQPMFYAVAAAIIGGTAMLGGSGTVLGAFLGAIVLATLEDGFSVAGVNSNPLWIIFGGAVIVAMIANVQLARLRESGRTG